ncbi:MAG: TetR/AcrR family transcriptional regulator [Acidimicrobiales bacterium]|nr:TetR/AcrR family transcriptional regulator [Acidimicrobiales bacterium]
MTVAAGTRDRILDALAEVVLEGGLPDFSVQGVADRCGISHRTVYRHFPTRESLLDGLVERMGAAMEAAGGAARIETLDELPAAVALNFALFSDHAKVAGAAVRFSVGTATENRDRRERTDAVAGAVARLDLDADDARVAAAVLRHLSSSRTWMLLVEAGLDATDTAAGAAWAVEVLIDALRAGRGPRADARRPVVPPTRSTTTPSTTIDDPEESPTR